MALVKLEFQDSMESRVKKAFQALLDKEENEASQDQLDPWV